jgi:methylsterol monooxygenase
MVVLNQLFISVPMVVVCWAVMFSSGNPCGPELPTFHRGLLEMAFCAVLEELLFYYSHRQGLGAAWFLIYNTVPCQE